MIFQPFLHPILDVHFSNFETQKYFWWLFWVSLESANKQHTNAVKHLHSFQPSCSRWQEGIIKLDGSEYFTGSSFVTCISFGTHLGKLSSLSSLKYCLVMWSCAVRPCPNWSMIYALFTTFSGFDAQFVATIDGMTSTPTYRSGVPKQETVCPFLCLAKCLLPGFPKN